MKRLLSGVAVGVLFLMSGCDKSKEAVPGGSGGVGGKAAGGPKMDRALVGEWRRTLLTNDKNGNDKLDDEERQPLEGMSYGPATLTIQADGKCTSIDDKGETLSGTCSLDNEDGVRGLLLELDGDMGIYRILGSDKDLVLKDRTGVNGTIYVFEKR
jgi:hypothetical protein